MRIGAYLEANVAATVVCRRYLHTSSTKDTQSILDPPKHDTGLSGSRPPFRRLEWYSANECWFPLLAEGPEAW